MYKKPFSRISKLIALFLIITCSVLFTEVTSSQIKDESGTPTTNTSNGSEESSNTFLYIGVAIAIVAVAVALLITNKSDKDKKTESEKNVNLKDSTAINKTDTTQIKK